MRKAVSIILFGLAPTIAVASGAFAAGKIVDMGYIDRATILRACQQAGRVPIAGGQRYGCETQGVSLQCDPQGCTAVMSDIRPLSGNSLRAIMEVMGQRAGRRILPLDTQIEPISGR